MLELLILIAVLAIIAAIAYVVVQQRRGGPARAGRGRAIPGRRSRDAGHVRGHDPMAGVVADHMNATDPHDVVVAEQAMKAQASRVAAQAHLDAAAQHQHRAAGLDANGRNMEPDPYTDPAYANPNQADPAYADPAYADPAYADPAYADRGAPPPQQAQYDDPAYADPAYADRGAPPPQQAPYADPAYADPAAPPPQRAPYADAPPRDDRIR